MKKHFLAWVVLVVVAGRACGGGVTLLAPTEGETVPLLNAVQKHYQSLPRVERIASFASAEKRRDLQAGGWHPKPVRLRWDWEGATSAVFSVTFATDPACRSNVTTLAVMAHEIGISNLFIATRYYWKVAACEGAWTNESAVSSFVTEDSTPRLMVFDKVPNARDLGGYRTLDGRRVRQGRVFRTAGLNENAETDARAPGGYIPGANRLTQEGLRYLLGTLGIRSDIDLRSDMECRGMTGSPLGGGVRWFHYSSCQYEWMQEPEGRAAFKKVFRVFLDETNYPIVVHCIAGQDRTGAVAFILNGLLGVPEEDLYRDWEDTGFWNPAPWFNHANLFDKLVAGFGRFPGATIQERITNYVLSLGFTKADIGRFRDLMLEPAV